MSDYKSYSHDGIANLRMEFPDIYRDFLEISKRALAIWEDAPDMDSQYRYTITSTIDICRPYEKRSPDHMNRVYLTSEFVEVNLLIANVSAESMRQIVPLGYICATPEGDLQTMKVLGLDCPMLWVFEGTKLAHYHLVSVLSFGYMIAAFDKENLLSIDHLRKNYLG